MVGSASGNVGGLKGCSNGDSLGEAIEADITGSIVAVAGDERPLYVVDELRGSIITTLRRGSASELQVGFGFQVPSLTEPCVTK
jgi:hypothetical protein